MGDLAARVRENLTVPFAEKRMFGGVSFLVDDKILVNVRGSGALMVRVDPARSAELVADHGAEQAEMGAGRSMGPSWLTVAADRVDTDDRLRFWLDVALDFNPRAPVGKR